MSEKSASVIGYRAVTSGNVAPLYCPECGEDTRREVESLTEEDMKNFERAACSLCESTFYTSSSGYVRGDRDV